MEIAETIQVIINELCYDVPKLRQLRCHRRLFNSFRVPTRPGKPGKMRVHLENLEISWNFEKFNKYHGKMT